MSLILDKNDRDALVNNIEGALQAGKRVATYGAYSTICVGRITSVGNYVLANFRIHFDLLKAVFDDCQYNNLGILDSNSSLFIFKRPPVPPSPTPKAPSRSKNSTITQIKKKTGSRAFMGRRFHFTIPISKAPQLYPSGFKKTATRKKATLLFPNIATNPQVASWFSTHQTGSVGVGATTNVPSIVSERGTFMALPVIATQAEHDAQLGSFDLATRARLDGTKVGKELDPA